MRLWHRFLLLNTAAARGQGARARKLLSLCFVFAGMAVPSLAQDTSSSERDAAAQALHAQQRVADYLERGELREAIAVLGPAIDLERRVLESGLADPEPARVLLASLYEAFGVALTHLAEFEMAAAAFDFSGEETAKLLDRVTPRFPPDDPRRSAQAQESFLAIRKAAAWRAAGSPERAHEALEKLRASGALERLEPESVTFFYSERGNAREDLGLFEEAIADYAQARAGWKSLGDRKRELFELKTTGDAQRRLGRSAQALASYEEALAMATGVSLSLLDLHECYTGLALVLMDLGRNEDALAYLGRATNLLESFHRKIAGSEQVALRTRSFATVARSLAAWARIRFERDGDATAQASLAEIDRWRGLGLEWNPSPAPGTKDLERERSRLRQALQMHSGDPAQRATMRQSLSEIELRLLAAKIPSGIPEPGILEPTLRDSTPPEGVLLLEYFLAPEDVFLWTWSGEGCRWFSLARGEKQAREFSEAVERNANALAFAELARSLLPPEIAAHVAQAREIWIVPDGATHRVSWMALNWNRKPAPPVSVLPSASFGLALRARPAPNGSGVDVFAFPQASAEGFDPLRFSETEGRTVAALFPGSQLRLGAQASEESLRTLSGAPGALLHISAHGILSPSLPDGAALLLAPGEAQDGWVWAGEIRELSFPDRLVVLSACHGGQGEWISGEGVTGLSRAFLAAGARTVVGALWAVEQESTTALMAAFHERLTQGASAGEALAQATQLLRAGKFSDPRSWAGFQVFGDASWKLPQSVKTQLEERGERRGQSFSRSLVWSGVAVLGATIFILLRWRKTRGET